MKTVTAIILAFGLIAAQAQAGGATLCPIYEFADLNTFTTLELIHKSMDFNNKTMAAPGTGYEYQNCREQMERIDRIVKARNDAKAVAK